MAGNIPTSPATIRLFMANCLKIRAKTTLYFLPFEKGRKNNIHKSYASYLPDSIFLIEKNIH